MEDPARIHAEDRITDRTTTTRGALLALAALFAAALTAVSVAEPGLLGPAGRLADDRLPMARIAGVLVAVAGVVWLWRQRRDRPVHGARRPPSLAGVLVRAGLIMAVFGLLLRFGPPPGTSAEGTRDPFGGRPGGEVSADAPPLDAPAPPPETAPMTEGFSPGGSVLVPDDTPADQEPEQARPADEPPALDLSFLRALGPLVLLLVLIGVVMLVFRALRGGFRASAIDDEGDEGEDDGERAAAEAEAGLVASLDEVRERRRHAGSQITAAYHRLLEALEAAGAGRQRHEAPHEHLNRALGPLGVRPEPLHHLAALYVAAEFSERPVTDRHRAAAAEALEQSLADLRSAAAGRAARSATP